MALRDAAHSARGSMARVSGISCKGEGDPAILLKTRKSYDSINRTYGPTRMALG